MPKLSHYQIYYDIKLYWQSVYGNIKFEETMCGHTIEHLCLLIKEPTNQFYNMIRYSKKIYLHEYNSEIEFLNAYLQ